MESLSMHFVSICIYLYKSLNGHDCLLPILELRTSVKTHERKPLESCVCSIGC